MLLNAREAEELGARITVLVEGEETDRAYALLALVLGERTPFRLLDRIGKAIGAAPTSHVDPMLERIASERTEGGWVVIASALGQRSAHDLDGAFALCRSYIVAADVWYGADILGERVPGPALLTRFDASLALLSPWRHDENRWVRRAVGVAVHFWGKRSRGAPDLRTEAERLLAFLEPMFEEWEMDSVKGTGWGLKTLGRHYPDLVTEWLEEQVVRRQRRHRTLMLRKATTYLSDEQRARLSADSEH